MSNKKFSDYLKEAEEQKQDYKYVVDGLEEIEDDIISLQKSCSSLIAKMKEKNYKSQLHETVSAQVFIKDLYNDLTKKFTELTKIKIIQKEK